MKKSIKTIMIVLLIILMAITACITVYAANHASWNAYYKSKIGTNRNKIIGRDGIVYNLTTNAKIPLIQYSAAGHGDGEWFISALEQPHVWCVQKGMDLYSGTYTVSQEYTASDEQLIYILSNGPSMTDLESNYKSHSSQIALWRYLTDEDVVSTDKDNILNGIKNKVSTENTENNLYKESENAKITVGLNIEDDKLKVSVNGSFENYDIYLDGEKNATYTKDKNEKDEISIRLTKNSDGYWNKDKNKDGKISVKVVTNDLKETVKYRILKNSYNQRIIVVTNISSNRSKTKDISYTPIPEGYYAVALEKFVTKVNGNTYNEQADINGDGIVDSVDYNAIRMYIAKNPEENVKDRIENYGYGDLDGDGQITIKDATCIQKLYNRDSENLITENENNIESLKEYQIKRYNPDLENGDDNKNEWKKNNPVKIQPGETVTYTLRLKNTGEKTIKVNTIYDVIDLEYINTSRQIIVSSGWRVSRTGDTYNITNSNGVIIETCSYVDINVTFTLKENLDEGIIIENTSYINAIKGKEDGTQNYVNVTDLDGEDNNKDMDFLIIDIKKYAASLEKFVAKVADINGEDEIPAVESNYITSSENTTTSGNTITSGNITTSGNIVTSGNTTTSGNIVTSGNTIESNNISFDYTGDNIIDAHDLFELQKYLASAIENPRITSITGDVNGDGNVNIKDATELSEIIRDGSQIDFESASETRRYNSDLDVNDGETNKNTWKQDNSVKVEKGDRVTYIIRVRNTGEEPIKVTEIEDIPNDLLKYRCFDSSTNATYENGIIRLSEPQLLKEGEYVDIKITFEVSEQSNDLIENIAKIVKIENEDGDDVTDKDADGLGNNGDTDFVKTKDYAVSLEKYIVKVTDAYRNNEEQYHDRVGKRHNNSLADGNQNKNPYKIQTPVLLEKGDIVTYTIRVTNTGNTPIKTITITDIPNNKLTYSNVIDAVYSNVNGKITLTLTMPELLQPGESKDIQIVFTVNGQSNGNELIENKAVIDQINNRNNKVVNDSDGTDNNADMDFLKTKEYRVSLEKYVSKVNGKAITGNRDGVDTTTEDKSEHKYDNDYTTNNDWKYNHPVTVAKGNTVTYTIKVKNDGETFVKITNIADYLPDGIRYGNKNYNDKQYATSFDRLFKTDNTVNVVNATNAISLEPGDESTIQITVTVQEQNISLNIMKNVAEITAMKNRNELSVKDATENNNRDADYIQMKDIEISGMVWNDKRLDKELETANGYFDDGEEDKLKDIKVYLFRGNENIAMTFTDANGRYIFNSDSFNQTVLQPEEKYIKGPMNSGTTRWSGDYYDYYVVFEYDGIKYTSTTYNDEHSSNSNDSNAKEDGEKTQETRETFNNRFSTINNGACIKGIGTDNNKYQIQYTTTSDNLQSSHVYNPQIMAMNASTNLIEFNRVSEEQLKHINLGLLGREIFDLELTSDVYSTKITVNEQDGVYNYSNELTLRRTDLTNYDYAEDMANKYDGEEITYIGGSQEQNIRETDISVEVGKDNRINNYQQKDLKVEVIYKITIENKSSTEGIATKITNYYDKKLDFKGAYPTIEDAKNRTNILTDENSGSATNYGYVTINTTDTPNTLVDKMEVYVVYELIDADTTLNRLLSGEEKIATYNMTEITEYITKATNNNEAERGLIDKDSIPGSANIEKAKVNGVQQSVTTVEYYFNKNNENYLSDLRYEDDTYAAPTFYFVTPDNEFSRTLTGVVFEDKTLTDANTKIKTGNGKLDDGEVGIYGATVELVELKTNKEGKNIARNEGVVRYRVTTDENGRFTISGFLPGYYVIRYYYGDTKNTVQLNQKAQNVNSKSFNGEDYQATNNFYDLTVTDKNGRQLQSNRLDTSENYFWYVYNETQGVSTAQDNLSRRDTVSNNLTKEETSDTMIETLNALKAGKTDITATNVNTVIEQTYMYATTNQMKFTVEKTIDLNSLTADKKAELIENNGVTIIRQDTNTLLGEWAMFPDRENGYYNQYLIDNMNFGIAEVPVTVLDLQKEVKAFTITDSTGNNPIVTVKKENGKWELQGDVLPLGDEDGYDVSIEDEKLQGARLQVTYEISSKIDITKNFDGKESVAVTINELIDYVNNNLSYNEQLGDNSKYWEVTTYSDIFGTSEGSLGAEGKKYNTIVKAKADNPILRNPEYATATITLEKVLSSTDATFDEIISSTVDIYEYNNIVEITELDYTNVTTPTSTIRKDLIRRAGAERYIILAKQQHDIAMSDSITIHPPTGDNSINTIYYIIAAICLVILTAGIFGIKKFVLNK